ncbi:class I SAM-dependent RNA methyltransferase [Marinococcus halophilus]|uniref:RNA methyltransferase n=1 Tax=Marinococcus halophilus TaxID=1371 RepID=A0A510Y3A6_MARHA|nr:class I SAM-dependent RNA methyltransferase [Marinococcus halophilus]OZT80733.1 class I SAM-dependent RNA methyltransferase [Marinococcus halophilus]GEK57785.1 RNA methyltransferase [Marinococcus halophilus]
MTQPTYTLIATATMGLEALVAKEIKALGYRHLRTENGRVEFEAPAEGIARANLWLRTAGRVKIKIGSFTAETFDELFEQTKALPWEKFLPENAEFPVSGRSVKSTLFSVSDCQAIVKKAIVERLKQSYQSEWFPENGALFRLEVALHKDEAVLSLDTSGAGLNQRGYRETHARAPLKETLAAALITLANWHPDHPLVDLFCGSGTIPIEAAMIGQNMAPGVNRSFVSETWPWAEAMQWETARQEAEDLLRDDQPLMIMGSDLDPKAIEVAEENAKEAGMYGLITFKQMAARDFKPKGEYGAVISNPPYGERIGERDEVEKMYQALGQIARETPTWSYYVLTSHERFEALFGRQATKRRKLYNGNLKTDYYQYWGPRSPRPS